MAASTRSRTQAPTRWTALADVLWVRLAVAAALVAAAFWLLEPLLYAVLGRAARDLVALSTAVARIDGIRWAGDEFAVSSPLYRGVMGVTAPWFSVALGVPLALGLSMPGALSAAGARRLGWIAVAAYGCGALALANHVLAGLVPTLERRGLAVLPPWRASLHVSAQDGLWEFAMVLLPAVLCLAVALPSLPWATSPSPAPRRARGRGALVAGAAALALAVALDFAASARLARLDRDALLRDLEPDNPELGGFLLRLGEEELAAGHPDFAFETFRLALRYPAYAARADAAMERLRAAP